MFLDILFYCLGCAAFSVAITVFLSANEISPGGFTGIATALHSLFGLPSGITLFVINVPVLILGFVKLGGIFVLKTAFVTGLLSVTLELSEKFLPTVETDHILAALFGGILMGTGISLVMLRGATTGGIDIIARLINRRFPHITVGRVILFVDAAVIIFASFVYGNFESALYSVVAMYASSKVMDNVLYGADKGKIIYIVTSAPDEICTAINSRVARGVTKLSVVGGYTGNNRVMLMCTVRRHEVSGVYSVINEFDPNAFIVVGEAGEIIGEGFKNINN